jgi:hypothetical protein
MRIPTGAYALLIVGVFVGTIGIAAAGGHWQTTGRTTGSGQEVELDGSSPAAIKGWMAIGDVADAWNVPLAELLAGVGLPDDTDAGTPLKELESETFSVNTVREWLGALDDGTGPDTSGG